jgi:hypothetical protein
MLMRVRLIAGAVIAVMCLESIGLAIDSRNAAYFGGTITAFNTAKDPVEGKLDTTNPDALIFTVKDKPFSGKMFSIPYAKVLDLEYGQNAGRRAGTAVTTMFCLALSDC